MLSTSSGDVQWDLAPVAVSDNLLTKTLFPFFLLPLSYR